MRKMWNPRNFKAHVSPHEMLQAVVLWSSKQFQITHQGDPIDFLSWFLHTTHRALRGNKDPNSSIINKSFLGQMKIYSRKIPSTDLDETQKSLLLATEDYQESSEDTSFLYLTCDLPAPPLFIDEFRENIIPQVSGSKIFYYAVQARAMYDSRHPGRLLRKIDGLISFSGEFISAVGQIQCS